MKKCSQKSMKKYTLKSKKKTSLIKKLPRGWKRRSSKNLRRLVTFVARSSLSHFWFAVTGCKLTFLSETTNASIATIIFLKNGTGTITRRKYAKKMKTRPNRRPKKREEQRQFIIKELLPNICSKLESILS